MSSQASSARSSCSAIAASPPSSSACICMAPRPTPSPRPAPVRSASPRAKSPTPRAGCGTAGSARNDAFFGVPAHTTGANLVTAQPARSSRECPRVGVSFEYLTSALRHAEARFLRLDHSVAREPRKMQAKDAVAEEDRVLAVVVRTGKELIERQRPVAQRLEHLAL